MSAAMKSSRLAITLATGHGWTAGDFGDLLDLWTRVQYGRKSSNIPAILKGLDCGRVLSAFNKASHPARDWGAVAYAAPGWADESCPFRVHSRLLVTYLGEQERKPKAPEKIGLLAWVVMHDMRVRYLRHEDALSPASVAAKVGFDVRTWERWREKKLAMEAIIERWDAEVVQTVAQRIAADREVEATGS